METNSEPTIEPPVDLNQPVENPALVAAINAFSQAHNEVTLKELLHQLNQANFLMASNNDDLNIMPQSVEGQAKINGLLKILSCSDNDGRQLLPVFTDWAEIKAFSGQKLASLVTPSSQLWSFVLDGPYEGIVVNPAGMSITLSLEQIKELQRQSVQVVAPVQPNIDAYSGRSRRIRSYHRVLSICLLLAACYFYRNSATGQYVALGVLAIISMVLEFIPWKRRLGRK